MSAPKQTETAQRWKVGLAADGSAVGLHTKIEFSPRPTMDEARVEPIAASVLAEHELMPFLAPHYPVAAALRQKVGALAGRSVVQARDVFDLGVLFAKSGGSAYALGPIRHVLPKAIERAMDVTYADFKSQVGSYLKPDHLDVFGTRDAWDALQLHGARVACAPRRSRGPRPRRKTAFDRRDPWASANSQRRANHCQLISLRFQRNLPGGRHCRSALRCREL